MTRQELIGMLIIFPLFAALFGWSVARWADVELAPAATESHE